MSDKILIKGLRVFGYHGVNRIEREHGQHFIVDVECRLDLREAGMTDLLGKTLDYDSLIKEVQRIVSMEKYTLMEALAQRIADVVLERPEVFATTVRVAKPTPPIEADLEAVQVEIRPISNTLTRAFIGLGSNVGDRLGNLRRAVEHLREHAEVLAVSSIYETEPVGPPQPSFLNAACLIETSMEPAILLKTLKRLEQNIGRSDSERWGPREIDLDLLLYGDQSIDTEDLVVPHPELTQRSFVMIPILEVDEDVELPSGEPLSAFCEREPQGVVKTDLAL